MLVGPDGVGKTTLACEVGRLAAPSSFHYFHFRPKGGFIEPEPGRVDKVKRPAVQTSTPPVGVVVGWLRVLAAVPRFWWSYLRWIRPAVRCGGLVVGDRWCYGYVANPAALGVPTQTRLAGLAVQLMPKPHLVVNLQAAAPVIADRKPELSEIEIEEELDRYRRLSGVSRLDLDATSPPPDLARQVEHALAI